MSLVREASLKWFSGKLTRRVPTSESRVIGLERPVGLEDLVRADRDGGEGDLVGRDGLNPGLDVGTETGDGQVLQTKVKQIGERLVKVLKECDYPPLYTMYTVNQLFTSIKAIYTKNRLTCGPRR